MDQTIPREQIFANIERIKAIEPDDLIFVERDLDFDEKVLINMFAFRTDTDNHVWIIFKVSLLFLLCTDDHVRLKVAQQQLYVASITPHEPTTFLHSWACDIQKTNVKWRDMLLEALCIIQAKAIIQKLGLNYIDLHQRFLPQNSQSALFVHPIVKVLYLVCEELTVAEAKQLIDHIATKYASVQEFNYRDNGERLEIYMMYWLTDDVLRIGRPTKSNQITSDAPQTNSFCNLDPITQFLKQIERDSLKEDVLSVCQKFNSVRHALIKRPSIRTDDEQPIDMGLSSRNFRAESIRPKTSEDSYRIDKFNVLIVNQKKFYKDPDLHPDLQALLPTLETRDGTDQDKDRLCKTFSTFGYRTTVRDNRNDVDLLNDVRNAANECFEKESLIVCILSHGHRDVIYAANSIPVKIEDIENLLKSNRLIGKPKILIVQACQGDVTQQAQEVKGCRTICCVK